MKSPQSMKPGMSRLSSTLRSAAGATAKAGTAEAAARPATSAAVAMRMDRRRNARIGDLPFKKVVIDRLVAAVDRAGASPRRQRRERHANNPSAIRAPEPERPKPGGEALGLGRRDIF